MISNQYQNQTSFNGNLLKRGINLPQKKFNEVAKIFAEKTAGKPDLVFSGKIENGDKGRFYHITRLTTQYGRGVAGFDTNYIKSVFKKLSPKKLAKELINLTRRYELAKEIKNAKERLAEIKIRLNKGQAEDAKSLQTLAERMETSIANKEKEYTKLSADKSI